MSEHQAAVNTDREIWRDREGDHYADSIHVTETGGIGINCGGRVFVKPVREWFKLAMMDANPMTTEEEALPMKFSERMFGYHFAESEFADSLCDVDFGEFDTISGDHYDNSIEFNRVDNAARMPEAAQRIVFDAGFSKAYVNHKDGWETHYSWDHRQPFKPSRGWRRRWVADPVAKTTNAVGAGVTPDNAGYYEISYWPEGWKGEQCSSWLETGYMRIVPDPAEAALIGR